MADGLSKKCCVSSLVDCIQTTPYSCTQGRLFIRQGGSDEEVSDPFPEVIYT